MTGLNGTDLAALPAAEQRKRARQMWHADPSLTGADLGPRFGKSARWGQQQRAAAEATAKAGTNGTAATQRNEPAARSNGTSTVPKPSSGTPERAAPEQRHAAPARPTPPPTREAGPVPAPLVAVTTAAVGLVVVVCAVVSYVHIRDLAVTAGLGSLASWLPLGVDGLVVASSCSVIVDRHLERHGQPLAWTGVVLGLAGSLAANVLAVDPDLVSLRAVRWVLAGYTPAALAVSGHLLLRMLGEQRRTQQ